MIKRIQDQIFKQNTYIFKIDNALVIIDPGYNYKEVKAFLGNKKPDLILLTHFHFDHVASTNKLCEEYEIKAYLHESEHDIIIKTTLSVEIGFSKVEVANRHLLKFDNKISQLPSLKVIHAPGHSPGSTLFIWGDNLFSGDVIFSHGIGKTTFAYGSSEKMRETLKKIRNLNKDYRVYPGHDDDEMLSVILKRLVFANM